MACFLWILSRRLWEVGRGGRGSLENPQERNNGRLFRKLFSAGWRRPVSFARWWGNEGTSVKKKAKIGVQTESARKDGEHEEEKEEEEERIGGHCDCLALTFASHILPTKLSVALNRRIFGRHEWSLLKDWNPLLFRWIQIWMLYRR